MNNYAKHSSIYNLFRGSDKIESATVVQGGENLVQPQAA